jgi:hypothetical protein
MAIIDRTPETSLRRLPGLVPLIRDGLTGQSASGGGHESGKPNFRAAQKNVGMIGHQRPGIDAGVGAGRQLPQTLDKILTISNIVDNPAFLYSSHHYMM